MLAAARLFYHDDQTQLHLVFPPSSMIFVDCSGGHCFQMVLNPQVTLNDMTENIQ